MICFVVTVLLVFLSKQDAAIHNHLLALYAQEEEYREKTAAAATGSATSTHTSNPWSAGSKSSGTVLRENSQEQSSRGNSPTAAAASSSALLAFIARPSEERFFDPMYALRLCSQHGRSLACVRLYSAMGLWEEAVDLALTGDTGGEMEGYRVIIFACFGSRHLQVCLCVYAADSAVLF